MRIDSHQHFWRYAQEDYPWISQAMDVLRRDFLPEDLVPHLTAHGLDASVAVQARGSLDETRWLCLLAEGSPRVAGVVGWVNLCADDVEDQLDAVSHPKLLGIRHIVQDEPDDRFMDRTDFRRGIAAVGRRGLVYDILVFERQLPAAIDLVRSFPDLPFVIDHIAKPRIADGIREPWDGHIRALASRENVTCKVSGLVTEAAWSTWQPGDLAPYLDTVLEAFGPHRLLYGSDWPVCLLAASYAQVYSVARTLSDTLSGPEQDAFFGGTAARVYGITPRRT
jgi:L-fuconolactonase